MKLIFLCPCRNWGSQSCTLQVRLIFVKLSLVFIFKTKWSLRKLVKYFKTCSSHCVTNSQPVKASACQKWYLCVTLRVQPSPVRVVTACPIHQGALTALLLQLTDWMLTAIRQAWRCAVHPGSALWPWQPSSPRPAPPWSQPVMVTTSMVIPNTHSVPILPKTACPEVCPVLFWNAHGSRVHWSFKETKA